MQLKFQLNYIWVSCNWPNILFIYHILVLKTIRSYSTCYCHFLHDKLMLYVKILMANEKLILAEKSFKEKALKFFTIDFYDFFFQPYREVHVKSLHFRRCECFVGLKKGWPLLINQLLKLINYSNYMQIKLGFKQIAKLNYIVICLQMRKIFADENSTGLI